MTKRSSSGNKLWRRNLNTGTTLEVKEQMVTKMFNSINRKLNS